jgi:hypothetical protein
MIQAVTQIFRKQAFGWGPWQGNFSGAICVP